MSEKLSKRMQRWGLPAQWPLEGWANEVATLEAERDELKAKLEAMEQAISGGGRLKAVHLREWARQNDMKNGYRGSVLSELLLRLAAAQEEQK
mgnify:CR=1 FL=1